MGKLSFGKTLFDFGYEYLIPNFKKWITYFSILDLPHRLKTKTLRAWLPKEDNKLAEVGTKSSPTKGSGTLMIAPRAYKPWVGRISCWCGTKESSPKGENPNLPRHLKTKTLRVWLSKEDNKLAGVGTKSSPTKRHFWGQCPSPVIVRFGDFQDFQPLALTPSRFCCLSGEQGTPLPLLHW